MQVLTQVLSEIETELNLIQKAKTSDFDIKPNIENLIFEQKLDFKGSQAPLILHKMVIF